MRYVLLPLLALGLSGCTLFQSNVKGGFVCGAARGTCAPSTTIDDAALRAIDVRKADPDAPATASPEPSASQPRIASSASAGSGPAQGALKVVYPAWRDAGGRVHKRTVAYISVDAPGLVATDGDTRVSENPARTNLLAIAETAPDLALVGPVPAMPTTQTKAAAPQSPAIPGATPIGAIQAQVRDILAKAPKPVISTTASASPSPDPAVPVLPATPATNGGTFPPQGE